MRRPWELLALAGVLALAAWLRFRHLELVEFKADEATAVDLARRVLDGHLPSVGLTSSVGALNPPLFVYLTAVPLAIRDDPLAATAFVGLLAVVAVGLTYVVLRPRFGALAALAAAALFATAPWAVLYGRKIWAQDMLPVFTVSLLWALFLVLERRRTRAVLLVPVLLCLTFQLNFSALALVVPAAVALAYRAREVSWRGVRGGRRPGRAPALALARARGTGRLRRREQALHRGARRERVVDLGRGVARGDPPDGAHLGQPQLGLRGRVEPAAARERRRGGLDARPRGELRSPRRCSRSGS